MAIARPIPQSYYYSGQGRLGIGDRDPVTGAFDNVIFVGNVTSLTVDIANTKFEHKESMTGNRAIDLTIVQEKNATFSFTAESLNLDLLATGLYGTSGSVTGATIASETHKVTLGKAIPLRHPNLTGAPTVNKSGSPVAEAGNWNYDPEFGTIYPLIGATGLVNGDTVTINYTHDGYTKVEAFTQETPPERYLRFEGLNTVDGSIRLLEIPRAALDPLTGLEYINEELGTGEFAGSILPDLTVVTAGISQYFREKRANPA